MGDILWMIFCLVLVFGVLFLFLFAMKKITRRVGTINGSKMQVLDRISLGRDGMILVVSVAGKLMLISSTPTHIEKICDLDISQEEYTAQMAQSAPQMSFASALSAVLARKTEQDHSEKEKANDKADD